MKGYWMPVYMYRGNKFIIMGNPAYDTESEAKKKGISDGLGLMAQEEVSVCSKEAYYLSRTEKEGEWMINANFTHHEIAIFSGPVWEKEMGDGLS